MEIPVNCKITSIENKMENYTYFKFNSHKFNDPVKVSLDDNFDASDGKSIHLYVSYGTINKTRDMGKKELEALCWEDCTNIFLNSTFLNVDKESKYFNTLNSNKVYTLKKYNDTYYISDKYDNPKRFIIYKNDIEEPINLLNVSDTDKCIFLDKFKNMPAIPYSVKFKKQDGYESIFNNHVYSICNETKSYYEIMEVFL